MTTLSMGGGSRLTLSPKKAGPQSPPFSSPKTAIILLTFLLRVSCGGLWQENLDLGTALILNQDDAGTLPITGSISCVTAVRLSIGAGRGRIIRQLLTESVLLASMSGVVGLAFAVWGIRFLTVLMSAGADRFTFHATLDQNVLALTGGLSLATGILFGLAPAIQATRRDVLPALKGPALAMSRHRWFGSLSLRRSLVVVQIVLATLLLVTTALFVRTLSKLESIQLGFNRDNLLTFQIDARQAGHDDREIV